MNLTDRKSAFERAECHINFVENNLVHYSVLFNGNFTCKIELTTRSVSWRSRYVSFLKSRYNTTHVLLGLSSVNARVQVTRKHLNEQSLLFDVCAINISCPGRTALRLSARSFAFSSTFSSSTFSHAQNCTGSFCALSFRLLRPYEHWQGVSLNGFHIEEGLCPQRL